MPSVLNTLLLLEIIFFNNVITLPNPVILQTGLPSYNLLQSPSKPSEVNNLQNVRQNSIEPQIFDVNTTIEQVLKMLERDPTLPRLTRGEIEDLFEQVTKEEYEKSVKAGDLTRAKHMRALMLVLPYNTENLTNDSLQELFNRPPVTKVIPSPEPKKEINQEIIVPPQDIDTIPFDSPQPPTTYKPAFTRKTLRKKLRPTTYRPNLEFIRPTSTSLPTYDHDYYSQLQPILPTPSVPEFQKLPTKLANYQFDNRENLQKNHFYKFKSQKRGAMKYRPDWELDDPTIPSITTTTTTTTKKPTTTSTTTTKKPVIVPELEDILESLGFAAQSQSKKRFKLENSPPDTFIPSPIVSSLRKEDSPSVEEFEPILSPAAQPFAEFKETTLPNIKPDDFVSFKPLPIPDDTPKDLKPELENYFKMFGLLPSNNNKNFGRSQKSMKLKDEKNNSIKTTTLKPVTNRYRPSAFAPSPIKRIDENIDESVNLDNKQHENPADQKDYVQLLKLLNNIRELQELNISLTEDRLKKLDLKNYNLSQDLFSQIGPDPINESKESYDLLKNEIKRQNNVNVTNTNDGAPTRFNLGLDVTDSRSTAPTTPSTTTTTAASTTTTTTSTTARSNSDAGGELADSFAGGLGPETNAQLPPPRRNGFYYVVDWNSFLEVGDGDDKVVVRFSPRAGDPSRFIPVKIP